MSNRIHDVAVPTQSAKNDLEKSIRIVTSLLYSPLPYSTFLSSTLLNLYPTSPLLLPLPVPLLRFYSALLYSTLFYSTLLSSNLLYSTLLYPTSTLLYSTILSSLPLLYLYACANWTQ